MRFSWLMKGEGMKILPYVVRDDNKEERSACSSSCTANLAKRGCKLAKRATIRECRFLLYPAAFFDNGSGSYPPWDEGFTYF
jgi:hypothetical protein